MKKVKITLLLLVASIVATFAQIPYKQNLSANNPRIKENISKGFANQISKIQQQKTHNNAKASAGYWINFGDALSADPNYAGITDATNAGNNLGGWPIWPDSNAVIVSSATPYNTFNWYSHGYADIFSPASTFIANYAKNTLGIPNGNLFFNRNNSYNIDSIRFYYGYFNHVSANDSLYVYVINYNSNAFGFYTFQTDTATHFGLVNYDYTKNAPTGTNITKYGFALTPGDSNGVKTLAVNLNLPASTTASRYGRTVAVAFRYKPNQPYALGDTLSNYGPNTNINKRLNGCNLLCYEEIASSSPTSYSTDFTYNMGNMASTDIRYNMAGGWNGVYATALAYGATFFAEHAYVDYHLSFEGTAFKFTKTGATYNFTDLSNFTPTGWNWDFGDGNTSSSQNPTNIYTTAGPKLVCLTATNGTKSYTSCQSIVVSVGIDNVNAFELGQVHPNPTVAGTAVVAPITLNGSSNKATVKVYNAIGQTMSEFTQTVSNQINIATTGLKAGIYLYSVEIGGQKTTGRFSVVE